MTTISIIVPCFNEEKTVNSFLKEAERVRTEDFSDIADFEYIFVDDGSEDNTLKILEDLSKEFSNIKYISFSRNFGKEAAIIAGLEASTGEYISLMDADLQDPPALLKTMYDSLIEEDFDKVGTRRVTRKGEPILRTVCAKAFYKLINAISYVPMVDGARDYILIKRRVADAILALPEKCRYTKGIFNYVGFKTKWIDYQNVQRVAGKTKWSFFKLFKYAVEGIVSFSNVPLSALSVFGGINLFISLITLIVSLALQNTVLAIITAALFVSGTVFLASGILGLYISQIFTNVKNRPHYIIKETNIGEKPDEKENKRE